MSFRWHSYSSPREAASACARHTSMLLDQALSGRGTATLAVSGGSTPGLWFQELVGLDIDWARVHLFWVDERAVPPTHEESNYRLAHESLIAPARVLSRNVHRIHGEMAPDAAAKRYVKEIVDFFHLQAGEQPTFDILQLGLGGDAHTASLFPGEPLVEDRSGIAAAIYSEPKTQWRISLLPGAILAAHHTLFLVTGAEKAEAVRSVFEAEYDPRRYPGQITHQSRAVVWFLDEAARSQLSG
ncbi:MAG: 6-phosphogluconolactonase [Bryobacteraceae bacterium]